MTKQFIASTEIGRIELGKKVVFNEDTSIEKIVSTLTETLDNIAAENKRVLNEYFEESTKEVADIIVSNNKCLLETIVFFANNPKFLNEFLPEGTELSNDPMVKREELGRILKETDTLVKILMNLTYEQIEGVSLDFKDSTENVTNKVSTYLVNPTETPLKIELVHDLNMNIGGIKESTDKFLEEFKPLVDLLNGLHHLGSLFHLLYKEIIHDPTLIKTGRLTIMENNQVLVLA